MDSIAHQGLKDAIKPVSSGQSQPEEVVFSIPHGSLESSYLLDEEAFHKDRLTRDEVAHKERLEYVTLLLE